MRRYLAVACPHCGRASVAKMGTRRRQCPYCGKTFTIVDTAVLAVGDLDTAREAAARHNQL